MSVAGPRGLPVSDTRVRRERNHGTPVGVHPVDLEVAPCVVRESEDAALLPGSVLRGTSGGSTTSVIATMPNPMAALAAQTPSRPRPMRPIGRTPVSHKPGCAPPLYTHGSTRAKRLRHERS